jgi:preprotein translocase YajC subunit
MLALAHLLAASTTSTTTTTSKSSGSSLTFLLPLLVIAALYLIFLRPRQQRARRAQVAARTGYEVGDRVQSVGGIKGEVVDIDGDDVRVEVADGVVLTFTARAIQAAPAAARTVGDDSEAFGDDGESYGDDEDGDDYGADDGFDEDEEPVVVPDDVNAIDFGDTSARQAPPDPDDDPDRDAE